MTILFAVVAWDSYGNRILRRLGLAEYEISAREEHLIRGWERSLAGCSANIVFFGDSITCGGKWTEYFEGSDVCSLAVPGDRVDQALYRADMVVQLAPRKIFILLGVNGSNDANYKEALQKNYSELIEKFVVTGAEVYIQSILPTRSPSTVENDRINAANEILQNIADKYSCIYIDLYTSFLDENGELKEEYSKDGVHINENGYELWVSLIREYIE